MVSRSLGLSVSASALLIVTVLGPGARPAGAQAGEHRWAGLVFDAFTRETAQGGVEAWTAEDGGRIRYRNPATGAWSFQSVPSQVKDTLTRVFFLESSNTGWAVGQGGWVLKTTDGGINWAVHGQRVPSQLPGSFDPWEELNDVHFLDSDNGWLVGAHSIWFSDDGGTTWTSLDPKFPSGQIYSLAPTYVELYAIDILVRPDGSRLGLIVGQPGIVLRSEDAALVDWELAWNISDLCPTGACGGGVLTGCACDICPFGVHPGPWFEPWDVEISRHATQPLAVPVGGIGVQCGMIFASTDNGHAWNKEWHECTCQFPGICVNCSVNPLYNDDPNDPFDLNRHKILLTLYGLDVFKSDNSAVAVGYNGQHLVRAPATGVWLDRSIFAAGTPTVPNSVTFPLVGADALVLASGAKFAVIGGMGGHLRESTDGGHTWIDKAIGEPHRIADVFFKDLFTGWRVGQSFRIARSSDQGVNWIEQAPASIPVGGSFQAITFGPGALDPGVAVGDPLVPAGATTSLPKIRRIGNATQSAWSDSVTILGTPAFLASLDGKGLNEVAWSGGSQFWAVGDGGLILKTTDGGVTWRPIVPELQSTLQSFQMEGVAFRDTTTGLIAGRRPVTGGQVQGVVYEYKDVSGSVSWTPLTLPLGVEVDGLSDVAISGNSAWIVGEKIVNAVPQGVAFTSTFSGGSFGSLVESAPAGGFPRCVTGENFDGAPVLNEVEIAPATGEVWVGGACGRLWVRSTAGVWSEVKSQTSAHVLGMSFVATGGSSAAGYIAGFRNSAVQQCIVRVQ